MKERILKTTEARIALDHNASAMDDSEQEGEAGSVRRKETGHVLVRRMYMMQRTSLNVHDAMYITSNVHDGMYMME